MQPYERASLVPAIRPYELDPALIQMYHAFGLDTNRKSNLEFVDENGSEPIIAYVAGNSLILLHVPSMKRQYIFGLGRSGIGSFVVHPSRETLAIGEKGKFPNVYIYEYPSLNVVKILRNGAVRGYACMCYSANGRKLATVSSSPDYMLSIWDWGNEQMLLQSKAFGQEVFSVRFSPGDDGRLTTSGTGHIRFWKMASTFTGLKLQGDIGKFGKVELTDIHSFVELPNNQVLSSTESGALLLWEGNFIKLRIMRSISQHCHDGEVTFLNLETSSGLVVSAGADGWVRYWSIGSIVDAEVDADASLNFYLEPTIEIQVGPVDACSISWMLRGDTVPCHYFVRDSRGKLWKFCAPEASPEQIPAVCLTTFHAGPVFGLAVSPMDHFAATAGSDGTVRCWDYVARRQLFVAFHDCPATSLCWAPASLDPQCRTLLVGFADGIVRVLYRASTQWLRIQCFKPHNASITNLVTSPDGKLVVSGCSEGIIFFVHTQELDLGKSPMPYIPAGFVNIRGRVQSLSWRLDSSALLAVSEHGQIIELDCSTQLEPDVPGTYKMQIPSHEFQISWPVEKEASSEDHSLEVPVPDTRPPSELQRTNHATYATNFKDGTMLAAFHERQGLVHLIDQQSSSVVASWPIGIDAAKPDADVVFMRYDFHNGFLVTGSADGSVSICFADVTGSTSRKSVVSQAHDADARVHGVSLSHDACFVLSVGSDGLLVVQRVRTDQVKAPTSDVAASEIKDISSSECLMSALVPEGEPLPGFDGFKTILSDVPRDTHDEARENAHSQADDLESSAYSFEDSRVKSEQDNYRAAAERKKEVVREVLAQMRRDFEDLAGENASQRPENQLQSNDLILDPDLNQMLEDQGETLLEEVRHACQYESERSKVLLRKLKDRYLNDLEKQGSNTMEGQSMVALLSQHRVGSFRVPQISGQLRLLLTQLHASLRNEEQDIPLDDKNQPRNTTLVHGETSTSAGADGAELIHAQDYKDTKSPASKESNGGAMSTLEARKLMRLNRQANLAALSLQRPAEDTDDPRDIQAIEHAKLYLGDYKLKSGEGYEVPHKQQINTLRKRRQMLLLQENINSIKLRYNKRYLALRDVKRLVTHSLVEGTQLLTSLDATLVDIAANSETPKLCTSKSGLMRDAKFSLLLSEWSDIVRSISHEETISFSTCQTNSVLKPERPLNISVSNTSLDLPIFHLIEQSIRDVGSRAQSEEDMIQTTLLRHKRVSIVARMNEHMLAFDNALNELRKEYMPLQADLKAAELRLLILLQELSLLKDFESRDDALTTKLSRASREKHEASVALADCSSRLTAKKADQELWQVKSQALASELYSIIPDGHQFHVPLLKIFRRKIKRSKKRSNDDGTAVDEEEDDDEFQDDDDDDNDDDDDSCPNGCDVTLYEQVVELREKRLDQEEILAEIQRTIDELQRTHDRHTQREKQIDRDVGSYSKEIRSFQTEKQQRLNKLHSTIALHLSQLYIFSPTSIGDNGQRTVTCYPHDSKISGAEGTSLTMAPQAEIKKSVLFSSVRLEKLHSRIFDLEAINKTERSNFKELHRTKSRLDRAKVARDAQITRLRSKCDDLQMLKFGQLIKLEILDRDSHANEGEETMNAKLNKISISHTAQLNKLKRRQYLLQEELLKVTEQNTQYLTQIAASSARQFQLEKELNITKTLSTGAGASGDSVPMIRREVEERNRLVALVKLQAKEVDALKVEINLLRRKGGHIYVPSLPASTLRDAKVVPSMSGVTPGLDADSN